MNADDWDRSVAETDAALRCYNRGRITSVRAMVFMEDSELAKEDELDVELHLNFDERFTGNRVPATLQDYHDETDRFLTRNKLLAAAI